MRRRAALFCSVGDAVIAIVSTLVMSAMTAALYVELRTVKEGATTEGLAAIFD